MKKKNQVHKNELRLFELIGLILTNKLKLIVFISISAIIGGFYNYYKPNLLEFSLEIKPVNNSELINYTTINEFIDKNRVAAYQEYIVTSSEVFRKFVDEFLDYQELMFVLKNNKDFKEQISSLSKKDQNMMLGSIARSFTLKPVFSKMLNENSERYLNFAITFVWNDKDQGINIIDETLNIVLKNLQDNLNNNLENYLNNIYNNKIQKDLGRIDYLTEQSAIAKELGIIDNQLNTVNGSERSVMLNFYSEQAYYLRGYKSIQKEISLIKERKHRNVFDLLDKVKELKKQNSKQWIYYDINLIKINSLKTSFLVSIIISIIIGLIIGTMYILIYSMIKYKK